VPNIPDIAPFPGVRRQYVKTTSIDLLKDRDVSDIETDHRRVEADVGFSYMLAEEVRLVCRIRQMLFDPVQSFEQRVDVCVVCFLVICEADFVDSIVDLVVDKVVHGIDLSTQTLGIEAAARAVDFPVLGIKEGVESRVEHANDLRRLIVDNGLKLLVPQGRHCVPTCILGIGFEIELLEILETIQRLFLRRARSSSKQPTVLCQVEVCKNHLNDGFEVLESPDQDRAMSPWAAVVAWMGQHCAGIE
jgi:hypothetical protein